MTSEIETILKAIDASADNADAVYDAIGDAEAIKQQVAKLRDLLSGSIRTEYRVVIVDMRTPTVEQPVDPPYTEGDTLDRATRYAEKIKNSYRHGRVESRQVIEGRWLPLTSLPQETPER